MKSNIEISFASDQTDPYHNLESIFRAFKSGQRFVSIKGKMKLTKTESGPCSVVLLNDTGLYQDVFRWVESRGTLSKILSRYRICSSEDVALGVPNHFAARVINGLGSISSGQNIFLFFPECLGIDGLKPEHFFGVELIDVWANIFNRAVFPCARLVFDLETQIEAISQLAANLDKTIYLASIFHEIGHQVGPWRVSPIKDPRLKVSQNYLDIMGEMATDSFLVRFLPEFPEVSYFVLLQRLFWFGRRGFRDNPISARVNTDNDSWLSAFLWNRLSECGAVTISDSRLKFDPDSTAQCFRNISLDIQNLGTQAMKIESGEEQDSLIRDFMLDEVEWDGEIGFILPEGLRRAYFKCVQVSEIPEFQPLTETIFS